MMNQPNSPPFTPPVIPLTEPQTSTFSTILQTPWRWPLNFPAREAKVKSSRSMTRLKQPSRPAPKRQVQEDRASRVEAFPAAEAAAVAEVVVAGAVVVAAEVAEARRAPLMFIAWSR